MKPFSRIFLGLMAIGLASCGQEGPVEPIVRVDKALADYASLNMAQQIEVLDSLRPEISAMMRVLGHESVSTGLLDEWSQSQVVKVFQPDVDSVYTDVYCLERQIGHILSRASKAGLQLPSLRFATVVWGNPRPIVRVDSIVLIALNHYLGPQYAGYSSWHEYRRMEKSPVNIPYDVASVLAATQHPMTQTEGASMLSWMLYEGALVEARMRMVAQARLNLALGYTQQQMAYVDDHIGDIWQEMAIKKLLYTTDPTQIDHFIASAPNTPLLGGQAPGRIGRYIGYRIVQAYLSNHKKLSLDELLSPDFYANPQTLIDSGFSPK